MSKELERLYREKHTIILKIESIDEKIDILENKRRDLIRAIEEIDFYFDKISETYWVENK